jgi:hypothetical protein
MTTEFGVPAWRNAARVRIDSLTVGERFMCCQGNYWTVERFHNGCAVAVGESGNESWFAGCATVVKCGAGRRASKKVLLGRS